MSGTEISALRHFAEGRALPPPERAACEAAAAHPTPLAALRAAADVLAAGAQAPALARPFGAELFRAQNEFNHTLVDVLEELPWLARLADGEARATARLLAWSEWRPLLRRGAGPRGLAAWVPKRVFLAATPALLGPVLRGLESTNRRLAGLPWQGPAARGATLQEARAALAPLRRVPWVRAQLAFLDALRAFFEQPPLRPAPPVARPSQSISVLLCGAPAGPWPQGVLEVLCDAPPAGAPDWVRRGDVGDALGEWILRLPGEETWSGAAPSEALGEAGHQLVYGDALIDAARIFRPGWSPEYQWSDSYIGEAFLVRAEVARAHGLTRAAPAMEWLLRPGFDAGAVCRVPDVLTRRASPAPRSAAEDAALLAELERKGLRGRLTHDGGRRQVRLRPAAGTRVSIVVPFKDRVDLLQGLWASLLAYDAGVDWELILASNNSSDPRTFDFLAGLHDPRVQWFEWNHPFNYSAINNVAARRAKGELLLFLNNDVAARHEGWLAELAGYAQHPEIGAVGARLLYPDGAIQHAGVVIGLRGLAGHVFARWRPEYGETPFGRPDSTRNWAAVTGACLMLRAERFRAIGGFDERIRVSGGDVELCLRACADGTRTVCLGHVELTHFESISRGREVVPRGDVQREAAAYAPLLEQGDPHYHPALGLDVGTGYPALAEPPLKHALRAIAPRLDR